MERIGKTENGREQPGNGLSSPAFLWVSAEQQVLSRLSDCPLCGRPLRGAGAGGRPAARADESGGLPRVGQPAQRVQRPLLDRVFGGDVQCLPQQHQPGAGRPGGAR
jgi:hypothetical protein